MQCFPFLSYSNGLSFVSCHTRELCIKLNKRKCVHLFSVIQWEKRILVQTDEKKLFKKGNFI